jgi:hypothetical protein
MNLKKKQKPKVLNSNSGVLKTLLSYLVAPVNVGKNPYMSTITR